MDPRLNHILYKNVIYILDKRKFISLDFLTKFVYNVIREFYAYTDFMQCHMYHLL